jgi:large subunit ribosomal protein L29
MVRLKLRTLRELNDDDLESKLSEIRADLLKLTIENSKGTLKKETGNMKWKKRDIARIHSILKERELAR